MQQPSKVLLQPSADCILSSFILTIRRKSALDPKQSSLTVVF